MQLKPLDDRIVIEPLESEDKTPGGILLPDQAKEKPKRGKVLAVGPGRVPPFDIGPHFRIPMTVKVGNLVCYTAYAGNKVTRNDGSEVLIMSEADVLAVIE